jgi:exodeoxyribonuclease V alpha subunit
VAKGKIGGVIYEGVEILVEGDFVQDPKYGRQFDVKESTVLESATVAFLYKCVKGIGKSLANAIVNTLGEDCVKKIGQDPKILYTVKGIKDKKHKMIMDSLNENKDIQLYIDIFNYFNNNITYSQAEKIVYVCKEKRVKFNMIKMNPYWLIAHVDGFGFKRVDNLALASGIGEYSLERISASIIYVLKGVSIEKGHCFLKMDELTKEVMDLLIQKPEDITKKDFNYIQQLLIKADDSVDDYIAKHKFAKELIEYTDCYDKIITLMSDALIANLNDGTIAIDEERIYVTKLYETETRLAESIVAMSKKSPVKKIPLARIQKVIEKTEKDEDIEYAQEQKDAVINALQQRVSIISGGPGRGKTTILKLILECWNDDESVILLAPTGRAAKKMAEATGRPAKTIDRYRNEIKAFDGLMANRPKNALVVFDEASMAGIEKADLLFRIAEDCNLIIVGDVDQLESIEPGTFLSDIIESGRVVTTMLKHGFRNDGSIAKNGNLINEGKNPSNYIYDEKFQFVSAEKEDILNTVVEIYKELLKTYDPSEIGIISPIRKQGFGCVNSINNIIRDTFNPVTLENPTNPSGFRIHDRVMNIVNDYKKVIYDAAGYESIGVFNGDTGKIKSIDIYSETLEVEFDDGWNAVYKFSEIENSLVLAYVITIHKSQGSEWNALIVIVSSEHTYFYHRKILYTAATRAKNVEYMVGSKKTAAIASQKVPSSTRNSYLKIRIQEI